jgi:hypothetical protein
VNPGEKGEVNIKQQEATMPVGRGNKAILGLKLHSKK